MSTPLWPHQQQAVAKLAPVGRGALWMDMGDGKTRTALELVREWGCRRVLILCPLKVVRVWPAEFRKHIGADWTVTALDAGTVAKRCESLQTSWLCAAVDGQPFAAAVNYDALVHEPLPQTLGRLPWDCLIADESHRMKDPSGKQAQAVAALAAGIPRRLLLTGTPMPHSPLDVFAQWHILSPETFGVSYERFRAHYSQIEYLWVPKGKSKGSMRVVVAKVQAMRKLPIADLLEWLEKKEEWQVLWAVKKAEREDRQDIRDFIYRATGAYRQVQRVAEDENGNPIYRHTEELQALLAPLVFRSSATAATLPPATDSNAYCLLGPQAQRLYHQLEQDFVAEFGDLPAAVEGLVSGRVVAQNAMVKAMRLAQIAGGFAVDSKTGETIAVGTEKADLLAETIADLDETEPVVVFARFVEDLASIKRVALAAGRGYCEVSGRRNELQQWQDSCGNEVLGVQLQAGGVGVDLTRARYQVYFSLDFSLGNYLQTRKRIHRPGQTRPVTYIHLLAAGTVDEVVLTALQRREQTVAPVVEGVA